MLQQITEDGVCFPVYVYQPEFIRLKKGECMADKKEIKGMTVLLTGATGAVGGAAALKLAEKQVSLVLLGRDEDRLNLTRAVIIKATGNERVSCVTADLSDIKSVKNAVSQIRQNNQKLDALLNVASVYKREKVVSRDGHELMFASNHLGAFVLTLGVMDLLKNAGNARVITVTAPSAAKLDFDDLQGEKKFNSMAQFGMTKMCNLLFAFKLARDVTNTGMSSSAYFPGLVRSKLTGEMPSLLRNITTFFSANPDKSGEALARLAVNPEFADINGMFLNKKMNQLQANEYSRTVQVQDRLWEESIKLTAGV
jgi:NAD(P)-dependent dehydrogenase (short-subunit alcohol dehydrogenase family)